MLVEAEEGWAGSGASSWRTIAWDGDGFTIVACGCCEAPCSSRLVLERQGYAGGSPLCSRCFSAAGGEEAEMHVMHMRQMRMHVLGYERGSSSLIGSTRSNDDVVSPEELEDAQVATERDLQRDVHFVLWLVLMSSQQQ